MVACESTITENVEIKHFIFLAGNVCSVALYFGVSTYIGVSIIYNICCIGKLFSLYDRVGKELI